MSRVLDEFYSSPWAIVPSYLETMAVVLERWASGIKLTEAEIYNAVGTAPEAAAQRRQAAQRTKGVAVIPVYGALAQRATMQNVSGPGVTSTQGLAQQFRDALDNPRAGSIVFDIDSPGGSVFGINELATEIRAARGAKRIVAVANSLAASAAYYIASSADEIVVTPGGQVGSIGVFAAHRDHSAKDEAAGVKTTLISAGKYKTEGNPYEPLSDEGADAMQEMVDEIYADFISSVAAGRGVSTAKVEDSFGQGRVVSARQAIDRGMADRIDTLDATIERLLRPSGPSARARAERYHQIESLNT